MDHEIHLCTSVQAFAKDGPSLVAAFGLIVHCKCQLTHDAQTKELPLNHSHQTRLVFCHSQLHMLAVEPVEMLMRPSF